MVKWNITQPSEGCVPSSSLGETVLRLWLNGKEQARPNDVRTQWLSSALMRRQKGVRFPHARLCRRSSGEEQGSYKAQVGGSIPSAGTTLEWRSG